MGNATFSVSCPERSSRCSTVTPVPAQLSWMPFILYVYAVFLSKLHRHAERLHPLRSLRNIRSGTERYSNSWQTQSYDLIQTCFMSDQMTLMLQLPMFCIMHITTKDMQFVLIQQLCRLAPKHQSFLGCCSNKMIQKIRELSLYLSKRSGLQDPH